MFAARRVGYPTLPQVKMVNFLITTAAPVARVARIHLRGFGSDVCLKLEKDVLAHEHSCHQYIQKNSPPPSPNRNSAQDTGQRGVPVNIARYMQQQAIIVNN